ncbi:hypothetical protein C1645_90026 [Glomus cerebriforme]|uniref:Uncharacterized protein n=1 Tax=Glomus cerebriforme TaxID=658196 RepID=A0A397T550_9GLOM|nr:hypothetical protein C1645_90026 [Glomus cerebriforme]
MMFSKEIYIHDAELEIVVPNGIIDFNEENIDDIIDAKQRTQIFYDELLHVYLISTLPPESNFENKAEATEFFKKLEVKLQATLIDTPNLSVPSNYHSSELIRRTSSSSSTASSISGIFSGGTSMKSSLSSTSTSPSTPGSPDSGYSVKRLSSSRLIEGTVIYSAQYDSKNNNNMVIVKRNDCWICVLPLLFPVAHIKSRAQNQIALNVTVTQSRRKVNSPDSYLYSMDNFGMNLLEGLNDGNYYFKISNLKYYCLKQWVKSNLSF